MWILWIMWKLRKKGFKFRVGPVVASGSQKKGLNFRVGDSGSQGPPTASCGVMVLVEAQKKRSSEIKV